MKKRIAVLFLSCAPLAAGEPVAGSLEITSFPAPPFHFDLGVAYYVSGQTWFGLNYGHGVVLDRSNRAFKNVAPILVGGDYGSIWNAHVDPFQKRHVHASLGHRIFTNGPLYVALFGGILGREKETYVLAHGDLERAVFQRALQREFAVTFEREQFRRAYLGPAIGLKFAPWDVVMGIEVGWMHFERMRQRVYARGNLAGVMPGVPQIEPTSLKLQELHHEYLLRGNPIQGQLWRVYVGYRIDWTDAGADGASRRESTEGKRESETGRHN